jgi:hypothetical protein
MMILSYLRKSERPVSTALILCLIFEFTVPYTSRAGSLASGGGTVASSLSSMVDGYTGDFRYSVPLVTVPGPNGESVDISASYRAGITVNQKASWIGLGWDYNPGEISRQVVNAPDDYNGKIVDQYSTYGQQYKHITMFGSLYNNEFNRNTFSGASLNKVGDNTTVYYSISATERNSLITQANNGNPHNVASYEPNSNARYRFNKHTVPYTSLAYDKYSVSGSGIGGSIHPYYLGNVQIHEEKIGTVNNEPFTSKKCQFYFENSTAMSVNEGNMANADVVNQSTNRIHSGTFVKYFTNAEINNNSNLYSGSNPSGYLDYKPTTNVAAIRRWPVDDPADAIGAFQVTNPAGITYHYSLPVYELENLNASFDGFGNSQMTHLHSNYYATSWKLTAITGPDYEDTNGNYTADEGDTGYWIAYNYSLWSDNYEWANQRYNAKSDALISPKMANFVTSAAVGNQYRRNNSLAFGRSQVYVLNYIRTATHTAYFVKSIRQDEQSYSNIMNTSERPVPSLKLDRVVLLKNEDKGLLINNTQLSGLDSRFNYLTSIKALGDNNFVNITRYTAYKASIDSKALATAELSYNYSLAEKYTGNINNTFTSTMQEFAPWSINGHLKNQSNGSWYRNLTGYFGTTATPSTDNGKLTLKKITAYSLKGEKITPSVDFGYDENNSAKNPDFDGDKTDLWGYYKSDYVNSHYVTSVSKNNVDAWSLKEINTSLGGKIAITYESDMYHQEGFNGDVPFYRIFTGNSGQLGESPNMPNLIFPMSNINISSGLVNFYDHDITHFVNFTNEPFSDPTYMHPMYAIYSQQEECFHPIVYYNSGNSSYYPPVYRSLVRYGSTFSGGTAGSGTGPYVSMLAGSSPEYNFNCSRPGYSQRSITLNNVGVNHAVVFRSYLYGGGVRVHNIKVTDPFSNSSYTQRFEYGKGYCPVVPKPTAFSTYSGPSNHDVVMNLKPMMAPGLTGLVGYDHCTQYSINQNNQSGGYVVQNYDNRLIKSPLTLINPIMGKTEKRLCDWMVQNDAQGNCPSRPYSDKCGIYLVDYKTQLDLSLNNWNMLGKLTSVTDGVTTTVYNYASSYIKEIYSHPKTEIVNYTNSLVYSIGSANHSPCRYDYTFSDEYIYDKSQMFNANVFLSSTETIKDDIKITEEIKRATYTAAPYSTKTTDPTRGTYESTTDFAFIQTVPNSSTRLYPLMDLKSKNETNRNLLTAVANTRTIKDGFYVISESKATYSNVYPIRLLGGGVWNVTKPWYHLHETYERLLDDDVPASNAALSTDWRKLSTNTLYDASYNCIEQEGLNGRRAASRWGYVGLYKLADISNANYNSFAFSGFEDPAIGPGNNNIIYGGEITNGQTAQFASAHTQNNVNYPVVPHTGTRMAGVPPNTAGPALDTKNFEVGRTYVAKVWVHKLSPATAALSIKINGTAGSAYADTKTVMRNNSANVTVGDWVLMSVELEVPANFNTAATHNMLVSLSNNGSASKAYFDDLAFHPKDAVMTGNVYNEKTGALEAQLDNDNFATFYTYDNAMRLTSASKEYSGGIKKVTESTYHYAKP